MIKYKCELGHEVLNNCISLCDSCLEAMKNQRNALLEFVKEYANPVSTMGLEELNAWADKLLQEVG